MKENAILINTARGGLIDEEALYSFLKERKIAGAAIDVFENEPNVGKLKKLDNIILTPHIGTYTVETRKHMEVEAAENLIKGLKEAKVL
jgi:D-3-phosphoglycerate dehydrogenase